MPPLRTLLSAAALAALATLPAGAQQTDPLAHAEADILTLGGALYSQFCASCHGGEARGDGPVAPLLTVPVPDLRSLAARNDGAFPMLAVIQTIDGRTARTAHGGPMPIWGSVFGEAGGPVQTIPGTALEARGRIMALSLWLESIQD